MAEVAPTPELTSLHDEFVARGMNENAARIMVAALRLFADKGYAATSVREIVRDAEVTNPMLYYYFQSKKGVFLELLNFVFDSLVSSVRQILAAHDDLQDQLRAMARAHFDDCRENPEVLRFVYSVLFGPASSRPTFDMISTFDTHHELLQSAIVEAIDASAFEPRPGFDARFLAERFSGLISNHLLMVLAAHDKMCLECSGKDVDELLDEYLGDEALDRMLTFFFNGAGTFVRESS